MCFPQDIETVRLIGFSLGRVIEWCDVSRAVWRPWGRHVMPSCAELNNGYFLMSLKQLRFEFTSLQCEYPFHCCTHDHYLRTCQRQACFYSLETFTAPPTTFPSWAQGLKTCSHEMFSPPFWISLFQTIVILYCCTTVAWLLLSSSVFVDWYADLLPLLTLLCKTIPCHYLHIAPCKYEPYPRRSQTYISFVDMFCPKGISDLYIHYSISYVGMLKDMNPKERSVCSPQYVVITTLEGVQLKSVPYSCHMTVIMSWFMTQLVFFFQPCHFNQTY